MFFISDVPFEKLGFAVVPKQPMPLLTANALGDGPTVILVGGALLSGLYWITERRAEVALAEAREKSAKGKELSHDSLNYRKDCPKTPRISKDQFLAHHRRADFRRRSLLDVCAFCARLPSRYQPYRSPALGPMGRLRDTVRRRLIGWRICHRDVCIHFGSRALPADSAHIRAHLLPGILHGVHRA